MVNSLLVGGFVVLCKNNEKDEVVNALKSERALTGVKCPGGVYVPVSLDAYLKM